MARPGPILVTGTHRSGSTWVGHMIASSPRVAYVHEPFNYWIWPECPVTRYFHRVTPQEEGRMLAYLREVHGVVPLSSGLGRLARAALAVCRPPCRLLVKDPFSFFSAEWWATTFGAQVVILVRHPAAFASSLKRLNWSFDCAHFRDQPELLRTYLASFQDDVGRHAGRRTDVIDDAILLWRLVYHTAWELCVRHPGWLLLRHEDLSRHPMVAFSDLFAHLDLPFTEGVRRAIEQSSSEQNPAALTEGEVYRIWLDSRANIWNWRQRLNGEEIERIRRGTEDLAPFFYTEADWDGGSVPFTKSAALMHTPG